MAEYVVWLVTQVMNHRTERSDEMQQHLTDDKSIYLQISQMIETDILRGILLEEERVPSTNELARLYTINPATNNKRIFKRFYVNIRSLRPRRITKNRS